MLALILCACTTTVKPVKVAATVASFDGTNQNSGVISYDTSNHVGIVTTTWRLRYNLMAEIYAGKFVPPLTADHGLTLRTDGDWNATAEAFVDMGKMQLWKRNNVPAK